MEKAVDEKLVIIENQQPPEPATGTSIIISEGTGRIKTDCFDGSSIQTDALSAKILTKSNEQRIVTMRVLNISYIHT